MKIKLLGLIILACSLSACDPNYENRTISGDQTEERAVVFAPDEQNWVLPNDQTVVSAPETAKPKDETPPASTTDATTTDATTTEANNNKDAKQNPLLTIDPENHPADFKSAGEIKPTVYYIPLVNETNPTCKTEDLVPMLASDGKTLTKVCPKTFDGCALQGSCFITNKTVSAILNHQNFSRGIHHFFEVDMEHCPFGQGVHSDCLDPFYTVAADLTLFKAGDVIYVPKIAGTLLPNGDIHAGYFIVRDMGGAIDGAGRFDFFSGFSDWRDRKNPFNQLKLTDVATKLPYYKVSGDTASMVRKSRNYPGLPGFKTP